MPDHPTPLRGGDMTAAGMNTEAKARAIAEKAARLALDILAPLERQMRSLQWHATPRAIIWRAVARAALDRAIAAQKEAEL